MRVGSFSFRPPYVFIGKLRNFQVKPHNIMIGGCEMLIKVSLFSKLGSDVSRKQKEVFNLDIDLSVSRTDVKHRI